MTDSANRAANAAGDDQSLDSETLSMIRDMVSEAPVAIAAPRTSSAAVHQAPEAHPTAPPVARPATERAKPVSAAAQRPAAAPTGPGPLAGLIHRGIDAVRNFRPTRRQIAWTALIALVLLRPAWVILGSVLGLFICLGVFLTFGADRVWSLSVRLLKWYMQRSPARGGRLAERIDRFALRWDTFLDRFPDGWVDGLYLPDFQSLMQADDRHDAVMATRLQRLQDQAEGV